MNMKIYLIIFLLFIGTAIFSQAPPQIHFGLQDTLRETFPIDSSIQLNSIMYSSDAIYIYGDTLKAIRMMVDELRRRDSIDEQYRDFMHSAACFINCVPDIFKNKSSSAWVAFWGYFKNNGYYMDTKKSKNPDCCACH